MTRFLFPILLLGLAVISFVAFTNPTYSEIKGLQTQFAAYNDALANAKTLSEVRDELATKYNSIAPTDLDRLNKLLPDNVDNIRLIIEIERIAASYGLSLTNVKYDVQTPTLAGTNAAQQQTASQDGTPGPDYGTFALQFATQGTYSKFLLFLQDLEHSLRMIDITSISFDTNSDQTNTGVYQYTFNINTYWLKN